MLFQYIDVVALEKALLRNRLPLNRVPVGAEAWSEGIVASIEDCAPDEVEPVRLLLPEPRKFVPWSTLSKHLQVPASRSLPRTLQHRFDGTWVRLAPMSLDDVRISVWEHGAYQAVDRREAQAWVNEKARSSRA